MEWLLLLIPIIIGVFFYFVYSKRITVIEGLSPLLLGVLLIFFSKSCSVSRQTSDIEYLNGHLVSATYYEDWTEPKTCYYTTCSGSGKTRVCVTHSYSCPQYHEEYWEVEDDRGYTWRITEKQYDHYVKLWNNEKFIELNRNYTSGDDGDAYTTHFDYNYKHISLTTTSHRYENKVQASHSLFKIPEVTEEEADSLGLFDYPEIISFKQKRLLGIKDPKAERKLQIMNAMLGKKKQVNSYLLVFKGKPSKYGDLQERYWMGGNKNEFNVILGLNSKNELDWFKIMTFSESQVLKIEIRNYLAKYKGDKIDLIKLVGFMHREIKSNYVRKNFHDFDYLEVDMTDNEFIWLFIIITIVVVGFNIYSVLNNHNPKFNNEVMLCGKRCLITSDNNSNYWSNDFQYIYNPNTGMLFSNGGGYWSLTLIRTVSYKKLISCINRSGITIDQVKDDEKVFVISKVINYFKNLSLRLMDKVYRFIEIIKNKIK